MLVAALHNAVLSIEKLIRRGVEREVTDHEDNNVLHYGARCADDLLIERVPRLLATHFNRHGQLPFTWRPSTETFDSSNACSRDRPT